MKTVSFWLKFSVFNLFVVSILGVLMRYKIAYSFPLMDQKHMQEAHSHFAFYAWITTVLFTFLLDFLAKNKPNLKQTKYYYVIFANVISSFGMLFTFIYGGYFWLSILFSTTALLGSFVFAYFFFKDASNVKNAAKKWFFAALFFAIISSAGVFLLAYMNATKNVSQTLYLASTYYYLHFQYNGFFIFSCIGLLINGLKKQDICLPKKTHDIIFWSNFVACIIGFGLSILYLDLGKFIFAIIFFGSLLQTLGAYLLVKFISKKWKLITAEWSGLQKFILIFVGASFIIKTLLQLFSNIPAISQFAFGFRNVVIAYLHLVLLVCISTFLLGQIYFSGLFKLSASASLGIKLFILGIFLNELVLGLMGIFSTEFISLPYAPESLVYISLLIMTAIFILFINLKKSENL